MAPRLRTHLLPSVCTFLSQGCAQFDDFEMENVFYCEDSCSPGCVSTASGDRDSATDYAQCQNIASRMIQKEANAHAQVRERHLVVASWREI